VHPTGLERPDDPDAKVKFLAAEAFRGVGGLVLMPTAAKGISVLQGRAPAARWDGRRSPRPCPELKGKGRGTPGMQNKVSGPGAWAGFPKGRPEPRSASS